LSLKCANINFNIFPDYPGGESQCTCLKKKLADSRLELNIDKKAVQFDVTDLSGAYAAILKNKFSNQRKPAEELAAKKLAAILIYFTLSLKSHAQQSFLI
jgi:hypothetical protein